MKNFKPMNLNKEMYRGTLKQIMKVRGLRAISLYNYSTWKNENINTRGIHSLKLDLQSGYINIFGYGLQDKTGRYHCSPDAIEDASAETYKIVYDVVRDILSDEANVPSKVKRNILVKMAR